MGRSFALEFLNYAKIFCARFIYVADNEQCVLDDTLASGYCSISLHVVSIVR